MGCQYCRFAFVVNCLFLILFIKPEVDASSCSVDQNSRIDCYPETVPQVQEHCEARGCCYDPHVHLNDDVPWCFYPSDYPTYKVSSLLKTPYGYSGYMYLDAAQHHPYDPLIGNITLDIHLESLDRVHIRLYDSTVNRFEVPISTPQVTKVPKEPLKYDLKIETTRFGIVITRKSTGTVIFNSTIGPLVFADQFLQISTSLPSSNLYGLGERHESALLSMNWWRYSYWARDQPPKAGKNLYGDHPFYLCIENDGNAHGVFFLNSNAKEVATQPAPALTWRSIGGIFDFYIFLGSTPDLVVQQYTEVIGKPFLPPMWALGFHLCRWGYNSSNHTLEIVEKMRAASIPQDVQWNDIDYMRKKLDFTYDRTNYKTLPQLVDNLHKNGQHYVMIIDPGISNQQPVGTYPPYDDGISSEVFIRTHSNEHPIEGVVWPGKTVFPDFTHPRTPGYWQKQLQAYHDQVPFDGVWVDMNEPSNFVHGSTSGCPDNKWENPVYVPRIDGGSLADRTLCASSLHHSGVHYDYHSLTGLFEMKATSEALINIRKKRPFVISRSTFPSAGKYGGHWNGDITSNWEDLKQSITSVINFNLFGIPMVGADICGFSGETTEELCTRWMQLGAFYPFSRNHNSILMRGQAPVDFSDAAQKRMRDALMLRYSYLPYLYTLFVESHLRGSTVARGVFMEFPSDKTSWSIDKQFMLGSSLMIAPIIEPGATTIKPYFPSGYWYIAYGPFGRQVVSNGSFISFNIDLNNIPIFIRGGSIVATQKPSTTTTATRKSSVVLIIAPDTSGNAIGQLFWDDGDSLDTYTKNEYLNVEFSFVKGVLASHVNNSNPSVNLVLKDIYLFNAPSSRRSVALNDNVIQIKDPYNVDHFVCDFDLSIPFKIQLY